METTEKKDTTRHSSAIKASAIKAGQHSLAGVKGANEDCSGILLPDEAVLATKGLTAVVADGVSSGEGGRRASESCVLGFLNDYYSTPESWTVKTSGTRVLAALNRWLHGEGLRRYGSDYDMLTTLSVLVIKSATAHIFHVGDTRVHRLRGGRLEPLTRDHRSRISSDRDVLSRAMGADREVQIDYIPTSVERGDVFVLTTDGVHEFLLRDEIAAAVSADLGEPERAARMVVEAALAKGSDDNLTCQVLVVNSIPGGGDEDFYRRLTELPFPPPLIQEMEFEGYKILRELHASKRTQVYLAVDMETGEKVVLKTPSVNYDDDPVYIDRFFHEEWVGRRIKSDHVLKVIEPERTKKFLYYATEYVEGQSLRQWMADNRSPSLTEVRAIIEQLIKGARAFHRREMLHQDLKPENIVMDTHGTVKIIDFGSVRVGGLEEVAKPIIDEPLLGTLNYAAPEYIDGREGTAASDLYSIGTVAYELITGKLPYGESETWRKAKGLRYVPARRWRDDVPAWVDGALRKAVHPDRNKRYQTLSEFLYDLNHPNRKLTGDGELPLIERNPALTWKVIAAILGAVAAAEFMLLAAK